MIAPLPPRLPPGRLRIRFRGTVQGVGFRPFLHGLAARHGLSGFVLNDAHGVVAEVEGTGLGNFMAAVRQQPPPLARIDAMDVTPVPLQGRPGFAIRDSIGAGHGAGTARIGADAATCASCLAELRDPQSRFHGYPFVTCTDCGPRFTIAYRLPYDRPNTSMAGFPLCPACANDFGDPQSRRFHAEAIACPACGPRLSHPVRQIAAAIQAGKIVALKGAGGFHLLCDAADEAAVQLLRRRKRRPHKPFAIMVADAASVERAAIFGPAERALLSHTAGPIVLLQSRGGLAPAVAPALDRIGIMLPSLPVHHLLFDALERNPARPAALVVTSANPPGEPLSIDGDRLSGLADLIVTHDRPIVARADDSVMAVTHGKPFFIRRARGFVPEPIDLGEDGPAVLAVGSHLKATICVTRGREAFVSQPVGDLDSPATIRCYEETARRLLATLDVRPAMVACDLHPDYRSTRFAEARSTPLLRVQHHAAHLAAVAAEHQLRGRVLGAALDGQGYGCDGGAWGGEMLLLEGAAWRRLGHLLPLALPGGDHAAREPWRMGVAALSAVGRGHEAADRFPASPLARPLAALLASGTGIPTTTSLGRLFDAAAALLGVCTQQSYEGQAAMELEALVREPRLLPGGYRILDHVLDFRPLLGALLRPGLSSSEGAGLFHGTLVAGLSEWLSQAAATLGHQHIALGGGCLANQTLTHGLSAALLDRGLVPFIPRALPPNDGGLSVGQAVIARAHLMSGP